MDIVIRLALIVLGSAMVFSGGFLFGAWWANRGAEVSDDWHDKLKL